MNVDYEFDLDLDDVIEKDIPKMQYRLDAAVVHYLRLYEPKKSGMMIANTRELSPGIIVIDTPYAHYQNEGKIYVDPIYGKAAFYSDSYGYWSRPGIKKIPTSRNLKHALGQSHFVERTLIGEKENIMKWVIGGKE